MSNRLFFGVTILSRSTLMLADGIVIGTTWYKLFRDRKDATLLGIKSLSNVLFVDGENHILDDLAVSTSRS